MVKEKHIGDRVRRLRRLRSLTQEELAQKAGVSADLIVKVENGQRSPRPGSVRKLAAGLGVEVEELTRPAAS